MLLNRVRSCSPPLRCLHQPCDCSHLGSPKFFDNSVIAANVYPVITLPFINIIVEGLSFVDFEKRGSSVGQP
jgi:hypothetical protein